jgi:hypothetical protein
MRRAAASGSIKKSAHIRKKVKKQHHPGFCFPARRLVFDAKLLTSEKYAFMDG